MRILLFLAFLFAPEPEFKFPANYREWVFLSSGLGMSYDENAGASNVAPRFDNVFVNPEAYRAFLQTGKWPEKTTFVLEIRSSESHGSINKAGHFQKQVVAMEAEVKENGVWTFYNSSAKAFPRTANCYSCHQANTAVDNTFVQFYPDLFEVATRKGTINPNYKP